MHQRGGGGITFLRRKLLSHSTKRIRCGTVRCFRKFRVSQNFMHKKGISLNSVENFLSHSAENLRKETRLCFRKFRVSKNFMPKRGISRFSIENFLSHSAEKFRRGTLQCVTNFGYRQILCFRELCHDFVSNFFVSQCRKISYGNPSDLCFRKFPGAKKFMDKRGGGDIKIFRRNFLASQCRKIA